MNKNVVEGNIEQIIGKVKEKWGELTNDEIARTDGKADKLAGLIKEKYGESQEEIKKHLQEIGIIS
tara:strand:- start:567 stop:764 length:198 start_codon:yes stop_codon:yes gene_type:complete